MGAPDWRDFGGLGSERAFQQKVIRDRIDHNVNTDGLNIWLMSEKLKRYYGRGDLHFVTFSCYRRLPLLKTIGAQNVFVHREESGRRIWSSFLFYEKGEPGLVPIDPVESQRTDIRGETHV